jgi:predicted methyltransferase
MAKRSRAGTIPGGMVTTAGTLLRRLRVALKRFAVSGPGRDHWQHPDRVAGALGLHPGDRAADLGSGGGYFTYRLARAVGPSGAVYAVDPRQSFQVFTA